MNLVFFYIKTILLKKGYANVKNFPLFNVIHYVFFSPVLPKAKAGLVAGPVCLSIRQQHVIDLLKNVLSDCFFNYYSLSMGMIMPGFFKFFYNF